ncbi:MAG: amidohydrolase family protein [Candidatus Aminicenantes bacterium]|nr:amidohydrolase family protein [Candidatus Aminicenantes bacterium]
MFQSAEKDKRTSRIFLIGVILLIVGGAITIGGARNQVRPSSNSYAITSVAVVDVEKGIILRDHAVIITGDRIERVAPHSEVSVPEGAQLIDGKGLYLMPGLVDSHVHYFDQSTFGRLMIAHGVVLVRDMGNPNLLALGLREKLKRKEILGPEMLTTGSILDGDPPFIPSISLVCKTPEDGRAMVRLQAKAGVDQVKVYSRLEKDVFHAIIEESTRLGLKTVGHVPEAIYLEEAAKAGQKSCEHLFGFGKVIAKLLDEPVELKSGGMGTDVPYLSRLAKVDRKELKKVLQRVRDSGMAVCPTIVVFKHGAHLKEIMAGEFPMLEYVSPLIRGIWKSTWDPSKQATETAGKIWPHMRAFVKELHKAGMTLMVGTDLLFPGIIPGYSVHEEMILWQEAGIPPADVLRSATEVPARFVGLDSRLGTVAEGKTASLVLVSANPLEDIHNASKIEGVFLRGRYFSRADLDQLLKETRELCKR